MVVGMEVARILSPQRAQPGFNRISRRNTGEAHSIPLSKPFPMRAVFMRPVQRRSECRAQRSCQKQTRRARGRTRKPVEALLSRDGLVIRHGLCAVLCEG